MVSSNQLNQNSGLNCYRLWFEIDDPGPVKLRNITKSFRCTSNFLGVLYHYCLLTKTHKIIKDRQLLILHAPLDID